MSYDLYFCRKTNEDLDVRHLTGYFKGHPNFKMPKFTGGSFQVWYENEDTGVCFSFSYASKSEGQDYESIVPEGFYDVGLSFNINYLRPSFFAFEAMPIVEAVAKEFRLLVIDPQDHEIGGNNLPKECQAEELIDAWEKSNTASINAYSQLGLPLLYMPKEKSMLWWRYSKEKSKLQEKIGNDIFVPSIFIMKRKAENDLFTAITWGQATPQIIPECDYILILREKKTVFGLMKSLEKGLISYHDVIAQMGRCLEVFAGPIPGLKILRPEKSAEAMDTFNKLEITGIKGFERIAPDGFVNVRI